MSSLIIGSNRKNEGHLLIFKRGILKEIFILIINFSFHLRYSGDYFVISFMIGAQCETTRLPKERKVTSPSSPADVRIHYLILEATLWPC